LGHGTLDSELTPRRVDALANVDMVGVECGGFHSMGYDGSYLPSYATSHFSNNSNNNNSNNNNNG
jgi:hypothetical protein